MSPPYSRGGSGKHTPKTGQSNEVEGDFAEFLHAEELKAKLAEEQEEAIKRELKATKNIKKTAKEYYHHHNSHQNATGSSSEYAGGGLGGRGKPATPEERWKKRQKELEEIQAGQGKEYVNDQPTLEERGYFPGDLMHHGHLATTKRKSTVRPRSAGKIENQPHSSPTTQVQRIRPPGICGPVSDDEEEVEEDGLGEGEDRPSKEKLKSHSAPGTAVPNSPQARLLGLDLRGMGGGESTRTATVKGKSSNPNSAQASRRNSQETQRSLSPELDVGDIDSYESSIVEPDQVPLSRLNASVISLKSFDSDPTADKGKSGATDRYGMEAESIHSGGANRTLARPLLELEELELDSFLKNFNRHTREVRVPHSANFPQRRMPRWEDFKVPKGEAALAAREGKKVTVLTHVDRGLKALEEAEGEGFPPPRPVNALQDGQHTDKDHHHKLFPHIHKKDKKKEKEDPSSSSTAAATADQNNKSNSSRKSFNLERSNSTGTNNAAHSTSIQVRPATSTSSIIATPSLSTLGGNLHPRVSWAPNPTNSTPSGTNKSSPNKSGIRTPPTDYGKKSPQLSFNLLRKHNVDKDERLAKKQEESAMEGSNQQTALGHFRAGDGGGQVDIHDEKTEWRPSRDEVNLSEEQWELLHGADEIEEERRTEAQALANGITVGKEEIRVDGDLPSAWEDGEDDRQVDGIAWAIAYILALIERHAPEELDNSPDQTYRESRTRSHIERLYLIAPFWERFLFGIRRVYRWDDPRRTSTFAMIYFTLWYLDLIPTAFLLVIIYYVCQFRFFPPSASFLHEQVRARMARGVDADRLAERLRRRSRLDVLELYKRFVVAYGAGTQLATGDIADFHEKVKNLILWRNPKATWRTLTLLGIATVFVTFASSHLVWKTIYAFLGFTFFILLPLQSHYPRFRRPLSPIWWALWGSPTDAQFAIQLLRRRHLERQFAKHPPPNLLDGKGEGSGGHIGDSNGFLGANLNNSHKHGRSASDASSNEKTGGGSGLLKNKFLRQSSAAHAVAYGALKPFKGLSFGGNGGSGDDLDGSRTGNLLDLQDVKVLEGGQILSRPRKLGSFFCQHHGVPGHLHVNTRMLYFVALHTHASSLSVGKKGGSKTCKTPLEEISGLIKTKSIKLLVWNSSGLQITRRNRSSLFFSNMPHRDNAFNLLLAIGSEVWHKHL